MDIETSPMISVIGGVDAFAIAEIGLYGKGKFFAGNFTASTEIWGGLYNNGIL